MKRRRLKDGALVPFSLRPKKRYPFKTPIPPGSVVRAKKSWRKQAGRRFRIGYYSWMDGLDCIWLVNDEGKYEQTIDHGLLSRHFEIEVISKDRSLYGKNRPPLKPIS